MTYNSEAVLQDGAMVLTVCPKCRHEFPPTASPLEPAPLLPTPPLASSTPQPSLCPCDVAAAPRAAPSLGGAAPAAWLPPGQPPGRVSAPSPTPTSAMLSLSITASSAASLNGGHVVVKTTPSVSAPSFSVTATLPAVAPMWAWSQPAPAPLPAPSLAPAPAWTLMPSASLPWAVPPQPSATWAVPPQSAPAPAPATAPLTLGLELFHAPVAPLGAPMGALGIARPRQPQPQPPCGMKGAQFRLTGGGILHDRGQQEAPVLLQPRGKPHPPQSCGSAAGVGVAPEQSPSTPLSFVLPGGVALAGLSLDLHALVPEACPPPARQPAESPEVGSNPEAELRLLQATTSALKASGWYYEGFSWQESADTLRDATPGTFLVRDSSDPRFLFSLSVQTDRGPTSVRLLYVAGGFRLDAEPHLAPTMPLFPCVLQLIEHYMDHRKKRERGMASAAGAGLTGTSTSTSASRERSREQVWVDARGQVYSHILLTAPRRHTVPGLQHLARLAVHKQLKASATAPMTSQQRNDRISKMELPTTLCRFLEDYPYTL